MDIVLTAGALVIPAIAAGLYFGSKRWAPRYFGATQAAVGIAMGAIFTGSVMALVG